MIFAGMVLICFLSLLMLMVSNTVVPVKFTVALEDLVLFRKPQKYENHTTGNCGLTEDVKKFAQCNSLFKLTLHDQYYCAIFCIVQYN